MGPEGPRQFPLFGLRLFGPFGAALLPPLADALEQPGLLVAGLEFVPLVDAVGIRSVAAIGVSDGLLMRLPVHLHGQLVVLAVGLHGVLMGLLVRLLVNAVDIVRVMGIGRDLCGSHSCSGNGEYDEDQYFFHGRMVWGCG